MLLEFDTVSAGAPPPACFGHEPARLAANWRDVTALEAARPEVARAMPAQAIPPRRRPRSSLGAAQTANPPLAVLADILRAPLVPIIGFAQLIRAELPLRHRAHLHALEIEAAAVGLLATLDALLAQASGRGAPAGTEPVVSEAADDALDALRSLLQGARHR